MTGPCTLLAEPQNQVYIDAAGVHVMPWHEIPFTKFRTTKDPAITSIAQPAERWAYSTRTNFEDVPVELISAVTAFSSGTQAMLTATNATKSNAFFTVVAAFLESNWADLAEQPFWEVLGSSYSHGTGHFGTSWVTKLVSTGGDVKLTAPANGDLATYGAFWYGAAIVVNACASDRTVKMFSGSNDAYYTLPGTVPANSYATIRAAGQTFVTSDPIGVKFLSTTIGDTFYVIQMGVTQDKTGDPFGPFVHTTSSDIPDTLYFDPTNLNPIDVFSGTNFESQGHAGETFWRVPITTAHIPDDTLFTVASRSHPMYLPFTDYPSYYWAITRMDEVYQLAGGDESVLGVADLGIYQKATNTSSLATGSTLGFAMLGGISDVSMGKTVAGLDNPVRQTDPFTCGLTVDGGNVYLRQGDTVSGALTSLDPPTPGWMDVGNEDYSDLLLVPGAYSNAGVGSYVMSREHAIFNRPLTEAEWAFLNAPDSVWTFGMFAEPRAATVTGLESPLYRGDDRAVTIQVFDADGDVVPLFGCTVWFTVKDAGALGASGDDGARIRRMVTIGPDGETETLIGEIVSSEPETGTVTFRVVVPPFAELTTNATIQLDYDVQIRDINGAIYTVARGAITATQDVTRSDS